MKTRPLLKLDTMKIRKFDLMKKGPPMKIRPYEKTLFAKRHPYENYTL